MRSLDTQQIRTSSKDEAEACRRALRSGTYELVELNNVPMRVKVLAIFDDGGGYLVTVRYA